MNSESTQEALFQDPIGLLLRQAREKAGLGVEQVGQQLRLPIAIVEAMERDDWQRLGAPVYVRSYLGSYLRLVGLPPALAEQAAQTKPTPQLVAMGSHSRMRRTLNTSMRNLVYGVMTAVLVVPVVLVARYYQAGAAPESLTLETTTLVPDAPLSADPAATGSPDLLPADKIEQLPLPAPAPVGEADANPAPVMASMAPFPSANPTAAGLLLRFQGESWIEVLDASGTRIERGLVERGGERRYAAGQVVRITLGNADVVDASFAGKAVDLAPFRAANVARFTVSSTGEPVSAGH